MRYDLPLKLPRTQDELSDAALDILRMTAYDYQRQHPGSDLCEVLNGAKIFSAALRDGI